MSFGKNAINLTYLGNSCILLTSPGGTQIVSDPYGNIRPPGLADLPVDLTAEAVTVSHTHDDHNNVNVVDGNPQILTEPGVSMVKEFKVTGLMGWEGSPEGPSKTMRNIVFMYEFDGIKIVQLGDSGIITDSEILKSISNADLVVVNIDGYVIPHDHLIPFMQQINARTILLAHYTLDGQENWCGAPTAEEFVNVFAPKFKVLRSSSKLN
ncbi:hypothetical protein EG832_06195, partial [bacterium]|nr:hypothetical protein [bacterium]